MDEWDTIRFKVLDNFANYIRNACEKCELQYGGDPIGNGYHLFAIYPQDVKEYHMAHGIEQKADEYELLMQMKRETA